MRLAETKTNVLDLLYLEALQFPDPTPMNLTTSNASDNDLSPSNNKTFYDKNLIRLVGPSLIHDQFGKKVNIPKNHGKTMEFRGFEPLAKATTPLTEGQTPNGKKLDMFTVTTTLKQYGDYVALSDLLEMTAIDNHVLEAQDKLGDQAGRTLDTVTREVINAGNNVQYAEGQVTSRATLTSAHKLTPKAIAMAVRTLKKYNAPKINGKYVGIISQDVAFDLEQTQEYKDLFRYTDNASFKNGYLFDLSGVEFYETSEAKKWRITPAYAGQMDDRLRFVIRSRDHPRIRGTNFGTILIVSESVGSPPHTRDKYNREAYGAEKGGIIPAYAGQIRYEEDETGAPWDHPRIRGTNT